MTEFMALKNNFYQVELVDETSNNITCDVNQIVQDWLMKEFDPTTMWHYTKLPRKSYKPIIGYGYERVTMLPEVYTVLVLKWAGN